MAPELSHEDSIGVAGSHATAATPIELAFDMRHP